MKNITRQLLVGGLLCFFGLAAVTLANAKSVIPAQTPPVSFEAQKIERFVQRQMRSGKIPGLALAIVNNGVVYQKCFGYANLESKLPVTSTTFFETGANSEAFTALGILLLREQGLLKLNDPVQKYLPWFYMKYRGRKAAITIGQLLRQTSGIPFAAIEKAPVSEAESALADTVKTIVGQELKHQPGERFLDSPVNYVILGLIIQQVSGESFERFIKINVLQPLGLNNTFLFREEAVQYGIIATGYKTGFMRPVKYDAPRYRGNAPALYYITNAGDLCKWLMIQLGGGGESQFNRSLINETLAPDYSVRTGVDGLFSGMGWSIIQANGKTVSQGGFTPTFSSFIILKPEQKTGVAVLANRGNIGSGDIQYICQGIIDLLQGVKPPDPPANAIHTIDNTATIVVYGSAVFIMGLLGLIIAVLVEVKRKKRQLQKKGFKGLVEILSAISLLALIGYCFYLLPDLLLPGFHWDFISVWWPASIIYGTALAFGAIILFFIHYLLISFFPKPDERPYFSLAVLSIITGLCNAFVIFTIIAALNFDRAYFASTLLFYCIAATFIYIFALRAVRKRMLIITNNIVYFKRITLLNRILKACYQKFEALEDGKIHAGLNYDTEVVSNFANLVIGGVTSFVTLIGCLVYMGLLNIYGLFASIVLIAIAAGLHTYAGKNAQKYWEQTRDIQNHFFRFINDLVGGFKELYLHSKKRDDFAVDMQETCKLYRDKRLSGEFKMINVFIIGEFLFIFVIASAGFLFPSLFPEMSAADLRTYILLFFYMTGPVNGVLGLIPGIIQFRISWKRIQGLLDEISLIELPAGPEESESRDHNISLQLEGVTFRYHNQNGEEFSVGPVNAGFATGEITFITGGNGSGKSTLAKLITGLYLPEQGVIKINGNPVSTSNLSQHFSAVFSDFHLFEKLYGIESRSKQEIAQQYLKVLKIADKVQIENGVFNTIRLSTGQKKRLALLVCYLEDRPIYLFDEWAADQDAEFRKFFYQVLLPQLRERGKCVIVISHDDRYFDLADQLIKMEMGMIVEQKKNTPAMSQETA
ncbi:MAG: cyclic peptide export ABC transporter [Firmicutes bacterium]|nr:cyclic peptide export ABC transporter [Bacillota bacterium]